METINLKQEAFCKQHLHSYLNWRLDEDVPEEVDDDGRDPGVGLLVSKLQ